MFLYWGAKKVSLVDGGYLAWEAAGLPLEKGKGSPPQVGSFEFRLDESRRVTRTDVEKNLVDPSRPLLDARSKGEFSGERVFGQKRGGHIPGARSVPIADLYLPNGNYIDAISLRQQIGASDLSPITYCVGGIRSALLAVLIEARLGIITANYDASIWDWASDSGLPLRVDTTGER